MREVRDIMGMPVFVEIIGAEPPARARVFDYFSAIDERFSTYKNGSEISRINRGEIAPSDYSEEMQEVLRLSAETKEKTYGYFDIQTPDGALDPSGLVKGWAIQHAAELVRGEGFSDFYIEAGGDIQTSGHNSSGGEWTIGIKHPFDQSQIVKVIAPRGKGVATSGSYIRGAHIYDPHTKKPAPKAIVSLTVIGPNVYEADRFATAAF